MEAKQHKIDNISNTPKRKQSDTEFSPESSQPQKVQKNMEVSKEDWCEVLSGIRKINNIETTLGNVMQEMAKLAKSEELEPLKKDIADIKNSQAVFKEKIENIEERICELESEFDTLKNSEVEELISEFDEIKTCTQQLSQSNLNNYLIIRHFPLEIKNDRNELIATVKKIFTVLEFDIHPNEYDVMALKVRNKDLAFIQVKFATQLLKSKVIQKFRQMKKIKANEPQFVVEMFTGLTVSHPLNGTQITMHNRLTKSNVNLLQAARKHVPDYFDFVFDDTDGRILAKSGNSFNTICTNEDISMLIKKIDETKRRPPPSQDPNTARSSRSGRGGTVPNTRGRGRGKR